MGCLIARWSGNESSRPSLTAPVGHPANCPSILAVGAVDSGLKIAWFSSGGLNKNGGQVDLVAPGVSVYSMINKQHEHDRWDGTSMATPLQALPDYISKRVRTPCQWIFGHCFHSMQED